MQSIFWGIHHYRVRVPWIKEPFLIKKMHAGEFHERDDNIVGLIQIKLEARIQKKLNITLI